MTEGEKRWHVAGPVPSLRGHVVTWLRSNPFGLELFGPWAPAQTQPDNPYRYNGKERNTDLGLNWYDYGARWYDPAVGRFTGVDPLADNYAYVTNYNYAENEPVRHIDLWGLQKALPPQPGWETTADRYTLKVTFKYNDDCRNCGTDVFTEQHTTEQVLRNDRGAEIQRIVTLETTRLEMDEDGNTTTPTLSTMHVIYTNGEDPVIQNKVEEIDLAGASPELQSEVASFSTIKKETGKSPIQLRAEHRAKIKQGLSNVSKGLGVLSFYLTEFVEPTQLSKVAALASGAGGVITGFAADLINTDPEKISFEKEYR